MAKKLSNSTSPAYTWRTVFFSWPRILTFRLPDLCVANRLFPWQRIISLQIIRLMRGEPSFSLAKNLNVPTSRLMRGEPSFSLAKNHIAPNYPTYAWRTVFFPGKKTFQLDFSCLCVANRLFPWPRIISLQIIRFMRSEPSFLLVMILATTEDNSELSS